MEQELIKYAPLFSGLDDRERDLLAEHFTLDSYAAQTSLFEVGEMSQALYLLKQGFVQITTGGGQVLATLGPGSVLGETSLFRNIPQDVSAVSVSELEFWKLSDRQLRDIILHQPSIGTQLSKNFGARLAQMSDYLVQQLASTRELGRLPAHTLQATADELVSHEVPSGELLYSAGEISTGLYLVENGAIEFRPENNFEGQEEVHSIGTGSLFGSLALLTDKPYTHSAMATENAILWRLPADKFHELNGLHPGLRRSLGRNVQARLSSDDQTQAVSRIAQMPLFGEIPSQVMQDIAHEMVLQHIPAGESVYRMGDAGDALYFVENGEIEVLAENVSGAIENRGRISVDGFFGEMSLLTGQVRGEDTRATRHTNLWVLYKSDLDRLAEKHPVISDALNKGVASRLSNEVDDDQDAERFRSFSLLADLSSADLRQVTRHLTPTRYRAEELIYRASSPPEKLYLLENGQIRLQPSNGGNRLIGSGETFGERALLTNQPQSASAMAETDVDLWTLNKDDFDMLLTRYPSLAINMSRMLSERMNQPSTLADNGFSAQPNPSVPSSTSELPSSPFSTQPPHHHHQHPMRIRLRIALPRHQYSSARVLHNLSMHPLRRRRPPIFQSVGDMAQLAAFLPLMHQ